MTTELPRKIPAVYEALVKTENTTREIKERKKQFKSN